MLQASASKLKGLKIRKSVEERASPSKLQSQCRRCNDRERKEGRDTRIQKSRSPFHDLRYAAFEGAHTWRSGFWPSLTEAANFTNETH